MQKKGKDSALSISPMTDIGFLAPGALHEV